MQGSLTAGRPAASGFGFLRPAANIATTERWLRSLKRRSRADEAAQGACGGGGRTPRSSSTSAAWSDLGRVTHVVMHLGTKA